MVVIYSRNGIPIRLTAERWEHITRRHPEMCDQRGKVIETVSNPSYILKGDFDELIAVRFYSITPLTEKYLVVPYKETTKNDGFVLTAYFAKAFSTRREVIWKS